MTATITGSSPATTRAPARVPRWHKGALVVVVLLTGSLGLTGCARLVKAAINHATHGKLDADEAAVNGLTGKMKQGLSATFYVTYVTSGTSPATVKVAAQPPKDFDFTDTTTSSGTFDIIQNASGGYYCNIPAKGATATKTTCTKLTTNTLKTYGAVKALYSGQYWINFLNLYKYAGVAGVTIESSTMTVNGFNMSCIITLGAADTTTTVGSGPKESTTVCVTSQGILGYVKLSTDSTAFELKSYSPSPPSSLFSPPPGATITTIPVSTTTTTS